MHKCPTDLQFARLAEGTLPEAERLQIAGHLSECALCRQTRAILSEVEELRCGDALPAVDGEERLAVLRRLEQLHPEQAVPLFQHGLLSSFFAGLVDARELLETMLSSPVLAGERGLLPCFEHHESLAPHLCAIRCEAGILKRMGITVDEQALIAEAHGHGWFVPGEGTPLAHLGKLLQAHGLVVERYFHARAEVLRHALNAGYSVMVAVDGGELLKRGRLARWLEHIEDFVARIPDHCVLVTGMEGEHVTVLDPASSGDGIVVPADIFFGAWDDSNFFLLAARKQVETGN